MESTELQMVRAIKADTISRGLLSAGFVSDAAALMPQTTIDDWNPRIEGHDTFRTGDIEWRGRIERLALPVPIHIEGRTYRTATVRDGVSMRLLAAMRQLPTPDRDNDALLDSVHTGIQRLDEQNAAQRGQGLYTGVMHCSVVIRDITLTAK